MKILNLKYKMHKLVNLVFYLIIFIFGFLLGFSTQKLDFTKLISEVLFIDSASAYTIKDKYDEEYIYNQFSRDENFNINDYPYIYVMQGDAYFNSTWHKILNFYAFPKDFFEINELILNTYTYENINNFNYYKFTISDDSLGDTSLNETNSFTFFNPPSTWKGTSIFYTSFEFPNLTELNNNNYLINVLDFSPYVTDLPDDEETPNEGGNNENIGGDNTGEDVEIEIVNSGFYEFSQKIFGPVDDENKFIYDIICLFLVSVVFILMILIIGYIIKFFLGG